MFHNFTLLGINHVNKNKVSPYRSGGGNRQGTKISKPEARDKRTTLKSPNLTTKMF